MVHAIVTEHGGYVSAQATPGGGCRIEMLLPRVRGRILLPAPAGGKPRSILLVDDRGPVRSQLHNFFEANGYNLLEAAGCHGGRGDRRRARRPGGPADRRKRFHCGGLAELHPEMRVIRIVDGPESGADEIQRLFTQQALLERVQSKFAASGSG